MSRCFLLEVNQGGVENLWLNTVNPPCFLFASLLKQPVISDSVSRRCVVVLVQVEEQRDTGTAEGLSVLMSVS